MSFRNRLSVFFVLIVIVPMVTLALLGFRLISDSETGKADARLAQGQRAALGLEREQQQRSAVALRTLSADGRMAAALRASDDAAIRARARLLIPRLGIRRLLVQRNGRITVDVGSKDGIIPATRRLVSPSGAAIASLRVTVTTSHAFADHVKRVSGLDVSIRRDGSVLTSTLNVAAGEDLTGQGEIDLDDKEYRYATSTAPSFGGGRLELTVLTDRGIDSDEVADRRTLVGLIIVGFLGLGFAFALLISRALSGQVARFLEAARRIGGGDFKQEVPTEGDDEFAQLGDEFNRMSRQLEGKISELERERARLYESIRRTGDAVASGLDRGALLEIGLETVLEGVEAECGRVSLRERAGLPLEQRAARGAIGAFERAIRDAETAALSARTPALKSDGDRDAIAFPMLDKDEPERVLGLLSVARAGRRFSHEEQALFQALAKQAAASIENVDLHQMVQRQAVTDELTGLFNHRRFQEVMENEVERAKRFGQPLGLLMLDIDNFKRVNDTHGHQQGDMVLREVARVLRESSREIDEPARYGGEELAVALPQTDLDGAFLVAERVRESIAALRIPRVDGDGHVEVTASFGVASIPTNANGQPELIAAADSALYAAKHGGKNQTVRAPADPVRLG